MSDVNQITENSQIELSHCLICVQSEPHDTRQFVRWSASCVAEENQLVWLEVWRWRVLRFFRRQPSGSFVGSLDSAGGMECSRAQGGGISGTPERSEEQGRPPRPWARMAWTEQGKPWSRSVQKDPWGVNTCMELIWCSPRASSKDD